MSEFVSYNAFSKLTMHIIRQSVDIQRLIDQLHKDGLDQDTVNKMTKEIHRFDELVDSYKLSILDVINELSSNEEPTITGIPGENGVEI